MENQSPPPTTADAGDVVMKESLMNTFCEITSASPSEALFYLESHNFNLESAISTFLETTNPAAVSSAAAAATASPNNARSHSPTQSGSYSPSQSQSSTPSRSRSPSPPPARRAEYNLRSSSSASKPPEGGNGGRRAAGGIRTLADLNRPRPGGDGADSDSDDDEPQEYYTGGEKSGMLVQDPSKSNDVDAIFDQARRAGAVERPAELLQPSSSSRSFTGTGRLLSGETVSRAPQPPEGVTHNITFWRNGFTIGDGPLRRFEDPENASFLESIRRSDCPKELKPANMGTKVHVNLIRKDENYTAQERPHLPFLGVGRTLGGTSDVTPTEPIAVASTPTVAAPPPSVGLVVDQTQPSTSIQLRLADGTRMVSRFNYHHTLRDIRRFIEASRPGGAVSYQLQTVGFPPKQLTDLDQTIEQAGLANSVVLQKLS